MAARQVSAAECFPHHSVGAGLLTRPPVLGQVSFHAEGFAPWGEFLSQRWERNQRIARGDSHRRREQVPSGSSSFSPGPPITGETPIPSCNISGAQNTVPGLIPFGPLGPGAVQNFGLHHFTTAPDSDQPWQRVRVGRTPIRPQWPPQAAPNAKPSEAGLRWRGGAMK